MRSNWIRQYRHSLLFVAIAVGLFALAIYLDVTLGHPASTPNDVAGSSSTMPTTEQTTYTATPGASMTDQFTAAPTEMLPPVAPPATSGDFQTGECLIRRGDRERHAGLAKHLLRRRPRPIRPAELARQPDD